MRRSIQSVLLSLAVLFFFSAPGEALARDRGGWHGGGHGGGGHGRGWQGGGGRGHGWHGGGHRGGGHGGGYGYYGHGGGRGYYGYGGGRGYYGYGYRYPRVVVGVGWPSFWYGAPYYGNGYGYGYGYGYYPPAVAYPAERPVYVQRSAPEGYWYYCQSEGGYYPDVPECPEEWVPVPPRSD